MAEKYVFGKESSVAVDDITVDIPTKEKIKEGFAMETKTNLPKYDFSTGKVITNKTKVVENKMKVKQQKPVKRMSEESTPEFERAMTFLVKDMVKNHGISRGAKLNRIMDMFQSFYSKAVEFGTSDVKKANRVMDRYL